MRTVRVQLGRAGQNLIFGLAMGILAPFMAVAQQPEMKLKACTPLPVPLNMHGCTVAQDRLYAIGGNNATGYLTTVYSAPITAPGELGQWRKESDLPEPRSYIQTSVATIGNRIYIVGGSNTKSESQNSTKERDVLWANVNADGTIPAWNRAPSGEAVASVCGVTCSVGNAIFYVGGKPLTAVSDRVMRSYIGPDGKPGPWDTIAVMPEPRWFHGGALLGERLYVWGGIPKAGNNPVLGQVYSSSLVGGARLGPWREEAALPQPMYSAAYCGENGYLVSAGGRYENAYPTNAIWYTRLEGDAVKKWHLVRSDLQAMVYHALAIDKRFSTVYIVGGQRKSMPGVSDENYLSTVQAFQLPK